MFRSRIEQDSRLCQCVRLKVLGCGFWNGQSDGTTLAGQPGARWRGTLQLILVASAHKARHQADHVKSEEPMRTGMNELRVALYTALP